jgi:hypothetical protein
MRFKNNWREERRKKTTKKARRRKLNWSIGN